MLKLNNPIDYFNQLTDPRVETKNKLHSLQSIVFIVLCATLCGFDDWNSIEDFAEEQADWLKQYVDLSNGIPSHDTLSRVFGRLDRTEFARVFAQWVSDSLPSLDRQHIAIDGKMIGGGFGQNHSINLVTAFATDLKLVLGVHQVDKKTNEINALPELLSLIDIKGSIVSMDAIYCQKDISRQIIAAKADYVLALKQNHKTLYEDVSLWLNTQAAQHPQDFVEEVNKDHGRIETRRYYLSTEIAWLSQASEWFGLKGLGMVESTRDIKGKREVQRRFYLTSLTQLDDFRSTVRNHWAIENQQHWVLDVAFSEDANRAYSNNQRSNLALFRRVALNLLRVNGTASLSAKRSRMKALMNAQYRQQLLFGKNHA